MDSVEPGLACGSDTSHLNIFGYDPRKYYRGRGAFESLGAGLHMKPGDIAFKSNFATYNPDTGIVERRRADRNFEHIGPELCAVLNGAKLPDFPDYVISVRYATEHRCGVVISGPGLSDAVSGTDPLKDNLALLECQPTDDTDEAAHTARVVNAVSELFRQLLEAHHINHQRRQEGLAVANLVLLRGCGSRIKVTDFQSMHGMRGCIVSPTKIIAGLGMSLGVDCVDAPGATGSYHSDFASKARTICQCVCQDGYEFGFVHIKAVDDTGHDRMLAMKVRFTEVADQAIALIVQQLWAQERQGGVRYTLVVTGDHSTPVIFGDHSHEPVPFVIAHIRHVVAAMGGEEVLAAVPSGPVPLPDVTSPPSMDQLLKQAAQQVARRQAAAQQRPFLAASPEVYGAWPQPWPQSQFGDEVTAFDELSAARGSLGRFTAAEVLPLIKSFTGRSFDV